jgi:uncharacterized repeat protein (TIGR03837 family)
MPTLQWDLFCRVVDNFGDVGVCWRLAADLAARGQTVRLFIDDASALGWMAPGGAAGVAVRHWGDAEVHRAGADVGDVVVEAFGCDPPPAFVAAMAARATPPWWVNLEYLSAEPYVERSHGLPSPHPSGLVKHFFYPGFTPGTGGLLREPGLQQRQAAFDAGTWLRAHGAAPRAGERVVSLFCYDTAPVDALVDALAQQPTLLLATAGVATATLQALLGPTLARGALRGVALPLLSQADYDKLLWAADLNLVRGEDSFVRAQWAGRPFLWQAYPQHDRAHAAKLDAFLARFLAGSPDGLASSLGRCWRSWNGLNDAGLDLPPPESWATHCRQWRDALCTQADLTSQLMARAGASP